LLQHDTRIGAGVRAVDYADTHANIDLVARYIERRSQSGNAALGERRCVFRRLAGGLEDGEFVTAQTSKLVARSQRRTQALRDRFQQFIARVMTPTCR
jgi:hypothetical protein